MKKNTSSEGNEVPLRWFTKSLWKYSPLYVELVFIAICIRLIGLVEPFVFQVIIDRILPFQREASLVVVVSLFAIIIVFQIGFRVLSTLLGALTANKVTKEFGSRIFDHLFKLPYDHFRKWNVGETIARVSETDTIRNFLVGGTTGAIIDALFIVVYLVVLFSLSVPLTWIVLIALPIQAGIFMAFGPFLRKRLRKSFDAGAAHQTQMVENIAGVTAVKALSAEISMLERLNTTLQNNLDAGYRVTTLKIWSSQLSFIVRRAVKISVIFLGATYVFAGTMTLGQLVAFHLLSGKLTDPITNFSSLWESWQNIKVSRQRLGDIVNSEPEAFGQLPPLPDIPKPTLKMSKVSFGYSEQSQILSEFDFEAKPNSVSLVVGPSGIGKSTFGRLAAGIDLPTSGSVAYGGFDLREHDPHDVRNKIAYVPQEPYLFSGTLRENLLIGNQNRSDEELIEALRQAAAAPLLEQLSNGLDTHIGERGSSLSGGQRQRITIARSLLKQPNILILDEPTSALDDASQRLMARELYALTKTASLIIITHRPEVFENPDQVIHFGGPNER